MAKQIRKLDELDKDTRTALRSILDHDEAGQPVRPRFAYRSPADCPFKAGDVFVLRQRHHHFLDDEVLTPEKLEEARAEGRGPEVAVISSELVTVTFTAHRRRHRAAGLLAEYEVRDDRPRLMRTGSFIIDEAEQVEAEFEAKLAKDAEPGLKLSQMQQRDREEKLRLEAKLNDRRVRHRRASSLAIRRRLSRLDDAA